MCVVEYKYHMGGILLEPGMTENLILIFPLREDLDGYGRLA